MKNGTQGLKGEYYNNTKWEGNPLFTKIDDNINFNWDINSPDSRLKMGNYSIKWTGYLIAPKTGEYNISEWSKPFMTVEIETGKTSGGKNAHHARIRTQKVNLVAGKKYKNRSKIPELLW